MKWFSFFKSKKKDDSSYNYKEIKKFYENLLKLKENRPHFDVDSILKNLYPAIDIEKLKNN
ncbi:hypothetical protein RF683_09895 [Flavobacterium sp. 20NA77.7]|uniref:Uncharacterized protein n=1 Tax=Flavobacterium nakdongensis TaxID=3073563 RepID=A0ABY9R9E9_9FLAO|nr:hypothetical protein [Flavobacterium sp. 20NA77.7]WMW77789.1 hypothetical protein RF683_09895 [Flavobacterium sp. 20NA77.7]